MCRQLLQIDAYVDVAYDRTLRPMWDQTEIQNINDSINNKQPYKQSNRPELIVTYRSNDQVCNQLITQKICKFDWIHQQQKM
jgi:hypothetical protein